MEGPQRTKHEFWELVSLAEYHMRVQKPRWTVRLPREIGWAFRRKDGRKVYFGVYDVNPAVSAGDYFRRMAEPGVNEVNRRGWCYCQKFIPQLSFESEGGTGYPFMRAVRMLKGAIDMFKPKKIMIKGKKMKQNCRASTLRL